MMQIWIDLIILHYLEYINDRAFLLEKMQIANFWYIRKNVWP